MLLSYPFSYEKELLSDFPLMYQKRLQKEGMKFEPYGDLFGQVFFQFIENLINNQDPQR